jgi:hypothetical protein
MRLRFRPTLEARHHTNSVGRGASERAIAESWLGAGHPLVGVLGHAETVFAQLVSVTAVQAAGVVLLFGNLGFGLSLAIAGMVAQLGLVCRLAALRARRREVCLELVVAGRESRSLACVAREWRRPLHPRSSESPLYGVDVESLRQELGRARYLLGLAS